MLLCNLLGSSVGPSPASLSGCIHPSPVLSKQQVQAPGCLKLGLSYTQLKGNQLVKALRVPWCCTLHLQLSKHLLEMGQGLPTA